MPFVYILKCADGSCHTGSTTDLELRLAQHQSGFFKGYTSTRLPVKLVWCQEFPTLHDAFLSERQIKGWTRAKKEALMRGEFDAIHEIVKRERKQQDKRQQRRDDLRDPHPSTTARQKHTASAQDARSLLTAYHSLTNLN